MRVSYRTFTGSSSYTANVADFKELISDVRRQLNIDGDSRVMIACGGKVFREPYASLEDIVAVGKPMVVRYELSKAALDKRRKDRKIVKVARNSGSDAASSSSSSSAQPRSTMIIMDDCGSSSSLATSNPFSELFRHGRGSEAVNSRDAEPYNRQRHFNEHMQNFSQSVSIDPSPTFGTFSGNLIGDVTGTAEHTVRQSVGGSSGAPRLSFNTSFGGSIPLANFTIPDNVPSSVNEPERFNGVNVNPGAVNNASRAELMAFSNEFENSQRRVVASVLARDARSNAVTVEDEKEEEAKEEEEYSEVSNAPMNASPEEIAVIAATIGDSESAWEVFRRGAVPRPFDMMDDTFIRGIRRHPDNLRALVASLLASNPQIIRRMMVAAADDSSSSDSESSDIDREELIRTPRAAVNRSDNNQNENSEEDSDDNSDNNDPDSPSRQVLINLIAEMMNVSREVALQALRENNFNESDTIDFIMNRDVPDLPTPAEIAGALFNSQHSAIIQSPVAAEGINLSQNAAAAIAQVRDHSAIMQRIIQASAISRRMQREPSLIRSAMMSNRQAVIPSMQVRMNVAPAAPYNEDFDGDDNEEESVMEEVD